jgi:hypothetical protein
MKPFTERPLPSCVALALCLAAATLAAPTPASAQNAPATITVDAQAGRHPISPFIYGVAFGSRQQLKDLNFTVNRMGGNGETRYNWKNNSYNSGQDWYFTSNPAHDLTPAAAIDGAVADDKADNAQTMVTISMIGWVAKIVGRNTVLGSFPVSKFGPQQQTDPGHPEFGNGKSPDGTELVGADPNDANVPSDVAFQEGLVDHLIQKWGASARGGVGFYIMDNEPSLWQESHRDVHPVGPTSKEIADDIISYASMVKAHDPNAQIVAPEEWGWGGYMGSGADQQYAKAHNYATDTPDRRSRGGMDNMPWILQYIHNHDLDTGKRTLDYFTAHIYPQGGDSGDDVSEKTELLRNRDTRQLWDPAYVDESWIKQPVMLIPRLKQWVATYYPGTKIGVTEYNWGAEKSMNGATAQADILGIFGREGVDLATRWTTPDESTPVFKAMQMYRNYDSNDSAFGSIGVADQSSVNPDNLSSFAAVRRSDGALTVMVINKDLAGSTPVTIALSRFAVAGAAQAWQLTSANRIARLADLDIANHQIRTSVPAQSITLFVVAASGPN